MTKHKAISPSKIKPLKPTFVHGNVISPGFASGVMCFQKSMLGPVDVPRRLHPHKVEDELARLDLATAKISDDLVELACRIEKELNSHLAEIFYTHKMILNDQVLRDEIREEIIENMKSAGSAVKSVFLRWESRFLLMESKIARDKGDDLHDISIRLRNALAGITAHPLENMPKHCVLVTQRLLPSDTVFLGNQSTAAVLLEYGSHGSHAALFTRQLGVPCISGIDNIFNRFPEGDMALIDGELGMVTVNASRKMQAAFQNKIQVQARALLEAHRKAKLPIENEKGVRITVDANIGGYSDTCKAAHNGADGIGLYRLEQFYIGRIKPPACEELVEELAQTLSPMKGERVCIRLLDIGADKPLPFLGFMTESNPALGRRGIRLLREYPELLKTQLNAILNLLSDFDIHIIVPMVTLVDDILFVKEALDQLCKDRNIHSPKLGAMIETPAAALSSAEFSPYVEFLSFGTNDLTQYTFAADRENAAVEPYFRDSSDVIFRLLMMVRKDVPDMPLSICGELAGSSKFINRLLQCGITSFSVAPPLVPVIKESIRQCISENSAKIH